MGGVAPGPEQPFIIGRYAVYGVIAPDGGSSVHYARLLGMSGFARTVAIKRIEPRLAAAARELLGGARRLTRIRHTNIVPTLDVVAERGELYLVMEYMPGETLERLLRPLGERGERIPPRIACGLVAGILRGLHAAHDAKASRGAALGLVHGDLAPHNVLVGADGVPRLLDFGLAKAQLPYVAPEQLRGPATRQSDIYACGLILWEALTGRSPVRDASDAATMERIEASAIEPPSRLVLGVPREVDIIALRALAREPRGRYATAKEMARDLEACIGGAATTDIGVWVEKNAGYELARRAAIVAAIESETPPEPHPDAPEPPPTPPPAPPDSVAYLDARGYGPPTPDPASGAGMYVRAHPESARPKRSLVPILMYALVGFALVSAVGAVILMTRFPALGSGLTPAPGRPPPALRDASAD